MTSRMCRASMLIVSSFVIALGFAASANAAAPRLIMFYGGVLSKPIILDDWSENLSFMVATDKPINMPEKELKDRLSIEVAFFWGQKWVHYIEEGKPLDQLEPKEAEQHGRYYPATKEGVTAVIVMDRLPYFLVNQTRQRQISSEGTEILKKHKMPVILQRRPPNTYKDSPSQEKTIHPEAGKSKSDDVSQSSPTIVLLCWS